jgi:hypothetical protein
MFSRILFSAFAAATLLAAAPAFAADDRASKKQCSCCSDDGSIHEFDHPAREAQQRKGSPDLGAQQGADDEDPFVRNQSFGG